MTISHLPLTLVQHWSSPLILDTVLDRLHSSSSWLRLPRHIRSRSFKQDSGYNLYVKGWEPLDKDYGRLLASLARRPYRGSESSFLEHFSHKEQKVPAMLRLQEAEAEVAIASYLQAQAHTIIGQPLDLPIPVALFKLTSEAKQQLWQTLAPHLDPQGISQCEEVLRVDEAAIYIYEQMSPAHRLEDYLSKASWPVIGPTYEGHFDPSAASKKWLYLFLFFLRTDVLAFHPDGAGFGSPFDVGNLCLSGGVADVGTCLMNAGKAEPSYVREGLEIANECLSAIFEKLHSMSKVETAKYLLNLVDELQTENKYLCCGLITEFRQTLVKQVKGP